MQDYFGKNADVLKNKKLYLFDMDGTIYRENSLFDGILEVGEANNNDGEYSLSDVQETAYAYVLSKIANSQKKSQKKTYQK